MNIKIINLFHWIDLYDILHRNNLKKNKKYRGVVHSFDGTLEELKLFLELDLFIGIIYSYNSYVKFIHNGLLFNF